MKVGLLVSALLIVAAVAGADAGDPRVVVVGKDLADLSPNLYGVPGACE